MIVEDIVTSRRLRDALPIFTAVASVLLFLAIGLVLYLGRDVFIPVTLAVILSFLLAPLVTMLQRVRVPRSVAVPGVVIIASIGLTILGGVLVGQIAQLAADLPRYRTTMQAKIQSLRESSANTGVLGRALEAVQDLGRELQRSAPERATPREVAVAADQVGRPAAEQPRPMLVEVQTPEAGLFVTLGSYLSPVLHPLATVGLILIFSVFILAQRSDLRNRFIRLTGQSDIQRTTLAIDDAARRLSRLFLLQFLVNTGFGTVIALGLWAIGVPSPMLWGIIAGAMRFVPYIGAVIGAALPLAVAVAVDPGWTLFLWTAALFVAVEPVLGHVVEPMLYGRSTGLSPIAVILAATTWTFLWGPIGLLLATPMTVCLVVLGRHVERLRFLDVMLGDRPALSPSQIFYQRMLAGGPGEAIEQARDFLRQRSLATYYDEVALQGIRLAQDDVGRGALSSETLATIRQSALALVDALKGTEDAGSSTRSIGAEAAAAVETVGPDKRLREAGRGAHRLRPEFQGACPVLCVAGQGPLDEAVAEMLGQLLAKHGLRSRVVGQDFVASDEPPPADLSGVALVCFSYMDALSTVHIRYAARRIRRKLPGVQVMVGLWRQRDPSTLETLRRATSAAALVTSLHDALNGALALSEEPVPRRAGVPSPDGTAAITVRHPAAATGA